MASSPTLPRKRLRWGGREQTRNYREAVGSVPNVFFVPLDAMFSQKAAELILKTEFAMMLLLTFDVLFDPVKVRRAH